MVELLSIEQAGPNYYVWVRVKDDYIYYWAKEEGFVEKESHLAKDYRNYEHFAGVVGKFNPYTRFLRDPVSIELNFKALLEACKRLNLIEAEDN